MWERMWEMRAQKDVEKERWRRMWKLSDKQINRASWQSPDGKIGECNRWDTDRRKRKTRIIMERRNTNTKDRIRERIEEYSKDREGSFFMLSVWMRHGNRHTKFASINLEHRPLSTVHCPLQLTSVQPPQRISGPRTAHSHTRTQLAQWSSDLTFAEVPKQIHASVFITVAHVVAWS